MYSFRLNKLDVVDKYNKNKIIQPSQILVFSNFNN